MTLTERRRAVEERTSGPLSPRERQVIQLAADDVSITGIAEALFVSPATVRTHLSNVYAKLRVRTRAGAVAKAMRLGLIT